METRRCLFGSEQIGDHVESHWPDEQPATPPVVMTGLYREDARIVSNGSNIVHLHVVRIAIVRDTPEALAVEASRLQRLVGRVADFVLQINGETVQFGSGWMVYSVPVPRVLDGFGGRFAQGWDITFAGDAALEVIEEIIE